MGGHAIDACPGGGWRCRCCKAKAEKWNDIAGKKCGGSAAKAWAKAAKSLSKQGIHIGGGHHRMLSGELIWCLKCAAYGTEKAIPLRLPCAGNPKSSWVEGKLVSNTTGRSINLLLLRGGRHTGSRVRLPPAVPEHGWSSTVSTFEIRTATTTGALAPRPKADMLARVRRKEAATKHQLQQPVAQKDDTPCCPKKPKGHVPFSSAFHPFHQCRTSYHVAHYKAQTPTANGAENRAC